MKGIWMHDQNAHCDMYLGVGVGGGGGLRSPPFVLANA